ncbi:MAG: methyltransferase [Planctomycetota bacterium]
MTGDPTTTGHGIEAKVAGYYTGKVEAHGAVPSGVDWNSLESQQLRFDQLLRVTEGDAEYSLLDWGCGYGALLDHLGGDARLRRYQGFDIAPAMVAAAERRSAGRATAAFTTDAAALEPADYVVASGIFNVRLDVDVDRWRAYVLATLERMAALARRGLAFNMLTSFSDADRRRDDLFYGDPAWFFDHCKRRLMPRVALLHDYPLWEFTVLARR